MGRYDERVKESLGIEAWNILIEEAKEGSITGQHMRDISQALHSTVGKNHRRRVEEKGVMCDDFELREVLSDWWEQKLFQLDRKAALQKISDILRGPDVDLPPVASKLSPGNIMSPLEITLASIEEVMPEEPDLAEKVKKIFQSIQEQEIKEMNTAQDFILAFQYIGEKFKVIMKSFNKSHRFARAEIEEVEDQTAGSFQVPSVKKFVFEEDPLQIPDIKVRVRQRLQEVKESRLKLLIMQILLNSDKKRRVTQVYSEYKAHIAAYDELEKNFNYQIEKKEMEQDFQKKERELHDKVRQEQEKAKLNEEKVRQERQEVREEQQRLRERVRQLEVEKEASAREGSGEDSSLLQVILLKLN